MGKFLNNWKPVRIFLIIFDPKLMSSYLASSGGGEVLNGTHCAEGSLRKSITHYLKQWSSRFSGLLLAPRTQLLRWALPSAVTLPPSCLALGKAFSLTSTAETRHSWMFQNNREKKSREEFLRAAQTQWGALLLLRSWHFFATCFQGARCSWTILTRSTADATTSLQSEPNRHLPSEQWGRFPFTQFNTLSLHFLLRNWQWKHLLS